MLTGKPPWAQLDPAQAVFSITHSTPPRLDARFSKTMQELVAMCLHDDPTKRPSADELLVAKFFRGVKSHMLQDLVAMYRSKASESGGNDLALETEPGIAGNDDTVTSAWNFGESVDVSKTVLCRERAKDPNELPAIDEPVEEPRAEPTLLSAVPSTSSFGLERSSTSRGTWRELFESKEGISRPADIDRPPSVVHIAKELLAGMPALPASKEVVKPQRTTFLWCSVSSTVEVYRTIVALRRLKRQMPLVPGPLATLSDQELNAMKRRQFVSDALELVVKSTELLCNNLRQ